MKKIYIQDFKTHIPSNFESSTDISLSSGLQKDVVENKLGIIKKPIENNMSLSELASESVLELMRSLGIKGKDVDFLVSAGSDFKDRYVWTMAPKLADLAGLRDAFAFDLSSQCTGSLIALDVAKSLIVSGRGKKGIVSVATKQSHIVSYDDHSSTFMYDFSDGSAAVLVSSQKGKYEILESSFISDGSFSDVVFAPFGDLYSSNKNEWSYKVEVNEIEGWRERMGEVSKKNFLKVIKESLQRSTLEYTDISYLAFLHTKRSFHRELLESLQLDESQSIYLDNYGHMQGVDPFLSLQLAERERLVHKGDIVVLVSAGTGWTWGATVVRAT